MKKLIGLAVIMGCACAPPAKPPFPKGFLWGAAVAGFQVDMGCPTLPASECNDPNSDWYEFITRQSELKDLTDQNLLTMQGPADGPGHWELYEQDFDLAKNEVGLNAFRMSIEWSRVFPTATDGVEGYDALKAKADPKALTKYHAIFAALKARGLTPMVTLNHYTLPKWIHDGVACHKSPSTCMNRGWLDKDRTVKEFAKYSGFVAREFGGEVDLWATENEPFAVVLPGYLFVTKDRINPPATGFQYDSGRAVLLALIEAHARSYDAVKANDTADANGDGKAAEVGLVYSMTPIKGKTTARIDTKAAENLFYLYNTVFLDAVCKGNLDNDLDGRPEVTAREDLTNRMDWLGVNYYGYSIVQGTDSASFPQLSKLTNFNPLALQLFVDEPQGLYELLIHVKDRYGLPAYITETGVGYLGSVATEAETATSWLARHGQISRRAIADGVDLRGFFYWSLIDNFEWNHGMDFHFGLYAVERTDAQKKRTARPAVAAYKTITAANDIPKALSDKYPLAE